MNLDELIKEGEEVKSKSLKKSDYTGNYLIGEDYEKWIAKAIIFMNTNYSKSPLYERFIEASKDAVGNGEEYYNRMMGILKGLKESY